MLTQSVYFEEIRKNGKESKNNRANSGEAAITKVA